jgi:hypothetical protein
MPKRRSSRSLWLLNALLAVVVGVGSVVLGAHYLGDEAKFRLLPVKRWTFLHERIIWVYPPSEPILDAYFCGFFEVDVYHQPMKLR